LIKVTSLRKHFKVTTLAQPDVYIDNKRRLSLSPETDSSLVGSRSKRIDEKHSLVVSRCESCGVSDEKTVFLVAL